LKTKWICGALVVTLLFLPLLAGCERAQLYPGEDLLRYEVAPADNPLRVNVNGQKGVYIQTDLSIEYDSKEMQSAFEERGYRMLQIANEYLRGLDYERLQDTGIVSMAGGELARLFNQEFDTESIQKVYLDSFMLAR